MNRYIETANFDIDKFPLDCGTLRGMQDNTAILAVLARIAAGKGTKRLILCGCESMGNGYRSEGYIWRETDGLPLTGEIIYHGEQRLYERFLIKEETETVNVDGEDYFELYRHREANDSSIGGERWSDYTRLDEVSNVALKALMDAEAKARAEADERLSNLIKQMSIVPKNMIMIWDLANGPIPQGWAPYEKMYGRFALGATMDDCGETGGEKSHTLTKDEMPSHKHEILIGPDGLHSHYVKLEGMVGYNKKAAGDDNSSFYLGETGYIDGWTPQGGVHSPQATMGSTGGGLAHNNMPPYVKLIYVIKL